MKTFNKIFMTLGIAAAAFGLTSCVNDLDKSPVDPNSTTDVSKDMDRVFADIYLNFATFGANGNTPVQDFDGGMASFQRAIYIGEEMTTDEACWLWDPEVYGTINHGKVSSSLDAVFGFYSRLIINITLCNQFIQKVQNNEFDLPDEAAKARAEEYVRQARILRGGCYYYMLTFYNNPPYADESTKVGEEPTQPGRAEVYNRVTADLEDVVKYYTEHPTPTYYGFVGLDAAEAILAKIYLNGEVFANTNDYAKCYTHCKNIIARLGKGGYYGNGLARSYKALFGYNNDQYAIGGANEVNEIIWDIPQSKTATSEDLTSWSGATFLVAAWIGTNGVSTTVPYPTKDVKYKDVTDTNDLVVEDADGVKRLYQYCATDEEYNQVLAAYNNGDLKDWQKTVNDVVANKAYSFDPKAVGYVSSDWFNSNDGWKCIVARKSFVKKFEWLDVDMSVSNDSRVDLWQTSSHGFTANNPTLTGDDWGKNGYLAPKYSNWAYNEDGSINYLASPPNSTPFGGDYAVIRLAEIYLTAAEAILQGGGGSQAEALQYVNYIRQRAYGDNYTPWTSLSMSDLQDERCRELYSENVRRTDLIRWNLWCTGYTWEWKGGIASGTNLEEYTKSFPIPSRVMSASHLHQIEGY